jgi:hypothetical protein
VDRSNVFHISNAIYDFLMGASPIIFGLSLRHRLIGDGADPTFNESLEKIRPGRLRSW